MLGLYFIVFISKPSDDDFRAKVGVLNGYIDFVKRFVLKLKVYQ